MIQIPQNELESNPKPRHLECSENTNLFMQIQMVMFWLKLWLIYHAKLFATNLFTQLAIYQVVFLLFWVPLFMIWSFFFCPKYPDPSKLAILRTWTPAVQVQGPFHWRVRWSLGCATKACFTWPDLVANAKNTTSPALCCIAGSSHQAILLLVAPASLKKHTHNVPDWNVLQHNVPDWKHPNKLPLEIPTCCC